MWDKITKNWVRPSVVVLTPGGKLINPYSHVIAENYHVCFFTDRLDKNGREICEGDILRDSDYQDREEIWMVKNLQQFGYVVSEYGMSKDVEIIGNRFENPEMVETHKLNK